MLLGHTRGQYRLSFPLHGTCAGQQEPVGTAGGEWWLLLPSASSCSSCKWPSLVAEVQPPC